MNYFRFAIIMTNYNNSLFTKQAINSLLLVQYSSITCDIIIIDNDSNKENTDILKSLENIHPIKVIYSKLNLGYFSGLNKGLEIINESQNKYNAVIIGNNDLIFPHDFFYSVIEKLELFNKYSVIAPNIITIDGIHQNPHVINRISPIRELIYDIYFSNYNIAKLISWIALKTKKITRRGDEDFHSIAQPIHQGYGACYLLGPLFFKNFNFLFAPTFLMGEEFFLSIQLESIGQKVFYEPSIIVKHHDHATFAKLPAKKIWMITRDSHKIYKKYRSGKLKYKNENKR